MIGVVKNEGLLQSTPLDQDPDLLEYFKSNWDMCSVHAFLDVFHIDKVSENLKSKVDAITKFYQLDNIELNHWTFQNLTNAFGDSRFFLATDIMARQLAKKT